MLKFPSIIKDNGDRWYGGVEVALDPAAVVAIEPRVHRVAYEPGQSQQYTIIHLASGATIEVFVLGSVVGYAVEQAINAAADSMRLSRLARGAMR